MPQKYYVLTKTAESDFREARNWSLNRWGKDLTKKYFLDLHDAAIQIAKENLSLPNSEDFTHSQLLVWPVREHYIVYLPAPGNKAIIIVSLIRQSRDVPAILASNRFFIERELKALKQLNVPD